MANHQHVQMLVDRVDCKGAGGISRGRQNVCFPTGLDDIGSMPATRTFCMIGMNGSVFKSGNCIFDKTGFIQRIGMNSYLNIKFFSHAQTVIDSCRCRPPVFMKFQTHGTCPDLLLQSHRQTSIPFTKKTKVNWKFFNRLIHALNVPWSGRTCSCIGAGCRSRSTTNHSGDTRH